MVDGLSGASAVTRQCVVDAFLASFDSHVSLSSIQLEKREVAHVRDRANRKLIKE